MKLLRRETCPYCGKTAAVINAERDVQTLQKTQGGEHTIHALVSLRLEVHDCEWPTIEADAE